MTEPDLEQYDDAPPWERREDEGQAAWAAWCCYRDLGAKRSLDAVDRRLYGGAGANPGQRQASAAAKDPKRRRCGQLSTWSRQYGWVARAAAWDRHLDQEARAAQVAEVREMNKRHAQEARALQARALESLRLLAARDIAAADVLRYFVQAARLERLALGEATEAVRQEVSGELRCNTTVRVVEEIITSREDVEWVRARERANQQRLAGPGVAEVADEDAHGDREGLFELPDQEPEPTRRAR